MYPQSLVGLCIVRALAGLGLAVASPAAFGITATSFPTNPHRTIAFSALALGILSERWWGPCLGVRRLGLEGESSPSQAFSSISPVC